MKVIIPGKFREAISNLDPIIRSEVEAFLKEVSMTDNVTGDTCLADNIYVRKIGSLRVFYALLEDGEPYLVPMDIAQSPVTAQLKNTERLLLHSTPNVAINPNRNAAINPNRNAAINPNRNAAINPNRNAAINPNRNAAINPNRNVAINPNRNAAINPNRNAAINPNRNAAINPNRNAAINPNRNAGFMGPYVFDLQLVADEFIVKANDSVILLFTINLFSFSRFGVAHNMEGFNLFDRQTNEWLAHMESDGVTGYNLFSIENEWIGIVK